MKRFLALTAAILTGTSAQAQAPMAFVACPIMRDTATVPCWLAEYEGELYFLVIQEDSTAEVFPPSLGHQALIEGTPTEARRCGGKVMENVRIAIRPALTPACNTILPASDAHQIIDPPRGPGPSNARPPGPAGAASPAPRPEAEPLTGSQRFEVLYDFDWQTAGRQTRMIRQAADYALDNPEAQVMVVGYRAAVELSDGRVLDEEEDIGARRAHELVKTLVTLGVEQALITESGEVEPELGDHTRRRAVIAIIMSGSDDHSEH